MIRILIGHPSDWVYHHYHYIPTAHHRITLHHSHFNIRRIIFYFNCLSAYCKDKETFTSSDGRFITYPLPNWVGTATPNLVYGQQGRKISWQRFLDTLVIRRSLKSIVQNHWESIISDQNYIPRQIDSISGCSLIPIVKWIKPNEKIRDFISDGHIDLPQHNTIALW